MDPPEQRDEPVEQSDTAPDPRQRPVTGAIDRMLDDEAHGRLLAEELAHLLGRG